MIAGRCCVMVLPRWRFGLVHIRVETFPTRLLILLSASRPRVNCGRSLLGKDL